jgi:RNA polymerase sigma factor (TIGR02999 family)
LLWRRRAGMLADMSAVTRILSAIGAGDPHAAEELLPLVYDELRRLAAQKLAHEKPGQTLDATGLVHEAYLRLVANPLGEQGEEPHWDSRGHFFAAAAEAMRRILVDRARHKATRKRGANARRLDLDQIDVVADERSQQLLRLDEALQELQRHDPQAAQLVKLRFFAGLTHQQAAQALGISRRAADRVWALARAWLYQQVGEP